VSPSLIGAGKLSRYRMFVRGTGPAEAGVQAVSKPEICHDAGIKLLADARVRVQEHLPAGRQESKNRDKFMSFIVRVIVSGNVKTLFCLRICLGIKNLSPPIYGSVHPIYLRSKVNFK
jgi:hypothetical protein